MPTDLPAWTAIALLVAGAACGLPWVVRVFGASVQDRILADVLRKLFEARDVSRAMKLLRAVGEVPVGQAARAALVACAEAEPAALLRAGYRGGAEPEAQDVLAPVRARYDEAFDRAMRRIRMARLLALPSLILLGLAGAAALRAGPEPNYQVAAGAGLGLLVLVWTARGEIRIAGGRHRLFAALELQFEELARDGARGLLLLDIEPRKGLVIEVREPGLPPREVSCSKEVIRIGRQDSAEVKLDAEGVARLHAVIERTEGEIVLIDLGAKQAARVNGEPVNRRVLAPGDVITVGEAELRVRVVNAPPQPSIA